MSESNLEIDSAGPDVAFLVIDDDVEADNSGHDSAFSLTPIADPERSAEPEFDDGMIGVADDEGEDLEGGSRDNDSTYGGSLIGCDSDTLASYITDYRYENGRRYHAYRDGEYWVIFSFFPSASLELLTWRRDPTTSIPTIYKIWRITCTS
jgi:hypothetical protein